MRFSISLKILVGYLVLSIFLAGASFYALRYLNHVADKSQTVVTQSVQATTAIRGLQIAMASIEQSQKVYLESQTSEILELFQFYQRHFDHSLRRLSLAKAEPEKIEALRTAYNQYLELFSQQILMIDQGEYEEARRYSADVLGRQTGEIFSLLDSLNLSAQRALDEDLFSLREFSVGVSTTVFYVSLLGVFCGLVAVFLTVVQLRGGISKLKEAISLVGQGNFDIHPGLRSGDEIQDLSDCIGEMAERLKMSEQLCLDASPLTYLPGNIAIERALAERIKKGIKFALCYVDLDDFKAYNDRYGYARGSEVIKAVADLLHATQENAGRPTDFIGHIGGDDFVYITDADNIEVVCEHIIREFDAMIPTFYSEEDREKGFITSKDRYGQTRRFDLMTISISVVSDARREIHSPVEIARIAAEIKEYVKAKPGSNYLVDRRQRNR